jgi:MOSC domain-containing protein YiiM
MQAKVVSINVSLEKGTKKRPLQEALLKENFGLQGDAHASGAWHRQLSLLALEDIQQMRAKGLEVGPGDFAENITTQGLKLGSLPVGTRLRIGPEAVVEITQIGKRCHSPCEIFRQAGDCIMPRQGVFARILKGGIIRRGDPIIVL